MTLGRKYTQSSSHGVEARKAYTPQSRVGSVSGCSSTISLCDMIEPLDWEEVSGRLVSPDDPLAYPENDVELCTVPKKIRTISHVLPDEDLSKTPLFVRDCIRSYTSDYTVVEYKYRQYSGSVISRDKALERLERLHSVPRHQYEVDMDPNNMSTEDIPSQFESQPSSGRQSVASMSSSSSCNETLTPRGSWASLDLRSSSSDPLLPEIFEKKPMDQLDTMIEARRRESSQSDILGLYTQYLDDEEVVERRLPAEMPTEVMGHRIMVVCHQLKLELDIEPLFASMALYDAKEKRKLSENFYFNLNSECTRQMLSAHIPHADISTLSRSCVFDIHNPTSDVFIVVRLEKVLQGDVNECVEPYIKDDKNREKVRASALAACHRLGKYRMPLAWSAVSLSHILSGGGSLERDSDKDNVSTSSSHNTNSLERKSSSCSMEGVRRKAETGLQRKGSVERRHLEETTTLNLDTFKPIVITVTSFFKQETDKLRDEDLYKFLAEIKRPSSAPKKLKCIPGTLKIEVSPCPDEIKNGLTPELAKLHPYGDEKTRPCKEVLPVPPVPPAVPLYQYRDVALLYVRDLNLANHTARHVSARNITVRIQVMSGEDQSSALPAIFGRSSCPEFSTEAYTTVLYHDKSPSLYDEIKIKLPADLGDQHHLFFTFIHISCQRKPVDPDHEKNVETVIGYSWMPLCRNGRLTCGDTCLPVMCELPPPNYSYISPLVQLPGTRWIDNHRPLFSVSLQTYSTVHPLDSHIERFSMACEAVQEGNIPPRIGLANMEAELRASICELSTCNVESLCRFLPVVLDKLILLLVAPPMLQGQPINIAHDVFTALTQIFTDVSSMNEGATCDSHGRSALISTYIQYQCDIPRPALSDRDVGLPLPRTVLSDGSCKILHEELALQWVVASGPARDMAMHNSWAQFELMVKSMVEYLSWSGAGEAPRPNRYPQQYVDDLTSLVHSITTEIISTYGKNSRLTQSLNNSLAFFLFDLISIMDRGYVLTLIRNYCKQISAKVASLPDAVPLLQYKMWFTRIVCSHEHLVPLSLPIPPAPLSPPLPPSPSRGGSSSSHSHLDSHHRARHYLVGLLLADLAHLITLQSPVLQSSAVSALLSVLRSHDCDPRLVGECVRSRVAALYLPLLDIVLDAYPALYRPQGRYTEIETDLCGEWVQPGVGRAMLSSETSRGLLVGLCWVLGWGRPGLGARLQTLSRHRVATLLHCIHLAFVTTEYKGRKEILRSAHSSSHKTTDIKAKLEDVILGQGSARSELIMRRKGASAGTERWRKERVWTRSSAPRPAAAAALSAALAQILVDALLTIVQTCSSTEYGHSVCHLALQVLLHAMQLNQSVSVLQLMLAALRSLLAKTCWQCGVGECLVPSVVLRVCGTAGGARPHASATLYDLMRHQYALDHNFSRVKMQVTMSLSSLVGTSSTFNEEALRRSLKTILMYAEHDRELQDTTAPEQIKELVFNLHMILSDTVKMKEYQQDPEMLLDLMYRIARGYQHSPDLRLTWLNNMAQKHMERGNHLEAGMCLVHGAALVAERAGGAGGSGGGRGARGGRGAQGLGDISHNVLDEANTDCNTHYTFTHQEMQALLEHAASEFMTAGMYELVNEVYKVLIPIAEENRDYKKLANIHGKLNEAFTKIEQLHGKRVFGTYFRVSFYGSRFGDLDGEEFIYKEHALTKLPEIFSRLERSVDVSNIHRPALEQSVVEYALILPLIREEAKTQLNFYGQRFGPENLVIVKDSNTIETSSLDSDKAYIQITYVEPYLEPHELRRRLTHYDRNVNIKRFMYATPFTLDGRAHGSLLDQCKRKTILTTAHHFPYVKTRIHVVARAQIILTPIEVAIEDIQKKTNELSAATVQEPADPKILQMVLQGCIGTTVNQGPLELAQVFLAPVVEGTQPPTRLTNKLRLTFRDFSKKCADALKKNKNLIGSDQREYQRELERNFQRFTERLAPLIQHTPGHVQHLTNGSTKSDFKNQS